MNKDGIDKGEYLASHGAALLDRGYNIVPIQRGKKAPGFDGWQKATPSKDRLREWLSNGHARSGLGIITKTTPAIDIDVRDPAVAQKVEDWIRENIGNAPLRVGRAPKRLMVFRTDKPFRKMSSAKWKDEFETLHQIEILGDGQQFVAYAIHPDTQLPYTWPNEGQDPLNVPHEKLPLLTVDKCEQLIAFFDELAHASDWEVVKKSRNSKAAAAGGPSSDDNIWEEDTTTIDIEDDELRRRLMLVPNPEDYETWINVGMSLYHQYDGEETGLELWHEWSETADNYDRDSLDRHWKSFNVSGKKRAPITARYILKMATEGAENEATRVASELGAEFLEARDQATWNKVAEKVRRAELDSLRRSEIIAIARGSRERITGVRLPVPELRKMLAYSPKNADQTPKWAENFVYINTEEKFFNTESKLTLSHLGFDSTYDRWALTKKDLLEGKSEASKAASWLALNIYNIKRVNGVRYKPGDDEIFYQNGLAFVNSYSELSIPAMPEKLTPRDIKAIERVKAHLLHLMSPELARRFLDWLAYIVQNPGKRVNYAVLLQGVEGDGKSFFAALMAAVMGSDNTRVLGADIFHSNFTGWALGQCFTCVEEVRLINDKNKYEVLNKVKPYITNDDIPIHKKGLEPYNDLNTTSYLLLSNFKDAIPIDDNSRRYLVIFSKWQHADDLREFEAKNPDYYRKLYRTVADAPGALRHWLMKHEISDDFDAQGKAPITEHMRDMANRAKPDLIRVVEQVIFEKSHEHVTSTLLTGVALREVCDREDMEYPPSRMVDTMLSRYGFESIGKTTIDGQRTTVWTKRPEQFTSGPRVPNREKILREFEEWRRNGGPQLSTSDPWDDDDDEL